MGRSQGTGTPISFKCYGERTMRKPGEHDVARTGRTRPNPSRNRGARVLASEHEYRCSCGHVGWTRHIDILYTPVEP